MTMRITSRLAHCLSELNHLRDARRRRPHDPQILKNFHDLRRTLPPMLLGLFDSRSQMNRRAFAPLVGELCGSCYQAQPATRREDLDEGKFLVTCHACGVVLFDPALDERPSTAA